MDAGFWSQEPASQESATSYQELPAKCWKSVEKLDYFASLQEVHPEGDVLRQPHEGGVLQGCVLQGDHPEGGVLRGPHLALGGGQQPPLLDEEVPRVWICLFNCRFRILMWIIFIYMLLL